MLPIYPFPNSHGHTVIWVVIDRLAKYAHFIVLLSKFTTASLAARFWMEVCRLHGIPYSIVSNRDKVFLSQFWHELFKPQGSLPPGD